ncbi:MAG: hypothetical protein AB7U45_12780 [Desulfamplus sp.]
MNAKNSIIEVVDNDLRDAAKNSAAGRSLNIISDEINFLINQFTKQGIFLKAEREELVKKLENIDTSFSLLESDKFQPYLKTYALDVKKVLEHCEELYYVFINIRKLDNEIERNLSILKEALSDQEIMLTAEGGRKYLVEKVHRLLPAYHGYSVWISDRIYRLNQVYGSTNVVKNEEKQNILRIIEDFDTSLAELSISGTIFAEIGRQLRKRIFSYQTAFIQYHSLLEEFQPLLDSMKKSQRDISVISEEIDEKVKANSEMSKSRILKSISSFALVSTGIFLLFNVISAALCFYIIKVFKISRLVQDLQNASNEIKILRGILPICCNCKKIRDDKGYWNQIEAYIHEHSEAEFSHGICPECAKTLYPDFNIPYDDSNQK